MEGESFPLLELPEELVLEVVKQMDKCSLSRVDCTCEKLHGLCHPELLRIAKDIGRPEQSFYDRLDIKVWPDNDVRSGMTPQEQKLVLADPNFTPPREYLSNAVENGAYDSVKFFLKAGLSVDTFNLEGCPILHLSIRSGHIDITKMLLEKGADVSLTMNEGYTPLDSLCHAPAETRGELARVLLETDSKVRWMELLLYTVLGTECPADLLERMLERGMLDLHTWRNQHCGETVLHIAASTGGDCKPVGTIEDYYEVGGNTEAVVYILRHAPELLNDFGSSGQRAHQRTALGSTININPISATYLIQRGITLARRKDAETSRDDVIHLLNKAVFHRYTDVVQALLARPELDGYGSEDWNLDGGLEPLTSLFRQTSCGRDVEIMEVLTQGRRFHYDPVFINKCKDLISKKKEEERKEFEAILELLEKAMS
ncbi:ankyrin [Aspergillus sclerotioniger CBS 115572]|uniref:Ankyrin n=1 Tax=Aspergillus sclerotioniger CBS 115572 TaxID=1450535 RepID=A0A317XCQ7_9EURO|nr:ankyrin [Aspergillus sclerotioniger CBS 115572]PWY95911.1 ankyrin [Aspergillus sclerotioniger CBS 115572]